MRACIHIFQHGLYEALEKSIIEQQIPDEEKGWWKWDSADSPYAVYGYDEFFGEVNELLDKRTDGLSDDELYGIEWVIRIDSMEEAMKRLDGSGLFGTGKSEYEWEVLCEWISLKFCERIRTYQTCKKAFVASRKESEFCSQKCKNQFNVYKSREKNKGNKRDD